MSVGHAGDEQYFLAHIPAPQDLEVQIISETMQHPRYVLCIQWRQHQQVCPCTVLGYPRVHEILVPFRFHACPRLVAVPYRLEVRRDVYVGGGGEVRACDDFEGDVFNALQTGNYSAAKAERRRIGNGDEYIEGAFERVDRHGGFALEGRVCLW